MAAGDISSITVNADAYTATIRILGVSTGGTYAYGLSGINNDPLLGAPKVLFTVTSFAGSDSNTTVRYVYGTIFKYQAHPNSSSPTETVVGSDVDVMIALSEPIYAKENTGAGNTGVAVTCTILSGFYTQGGTPNNAVTNMTVTNNSTLAYFKVIGNWTCAPFRRVSSNTLRLSALAFSMHPQHRRPVERVRFTVTDGTNTVTKDVYEMRIDKSQGDKLPFPEYYADIDVSTLIQGSELTANFAAYPFIGDAASIRDSSTGIAMPSARCGPHKYLLDRTNAYGVTIALVDAATGSDAGANTVYDSASYNPATAYKFATIGKAAAAIASYNNTNRSRNDVGAGVIELNAGSYAWLGSTNTYGTTPKCHITVRPATGVAKSAVNLSSTSGNTDISDRVCLSRVTITTGTNNTFTGINAMWLDDCDYNSTAGTGIFNNIGGAVWVTRGKVTNLNQGFRPSSTNNAPFALVRGVDLGAFTKTILCYTVCGNHKYGKVVPGTLFTTEYAGMGAPDPSIEGNWIIYNNIATGLGTPAIMFETGTKFANPYGGAFIQNILENCYTDPNGLADIGSSDTVTTNTPLRGFLIWHNTLVGNRVFIGYNDNAAPSIFKDRYYWSVIGNYMDRAATKGSEHPTADSVRIGNMTQLHGVGYMGNHFEMNMISGASFYFRFVGLSSFQPAAGVTGTASNAQFKDRRSTTEVAGSLVAGSGDGDYRTPSTSPLFGKLLFSPIPYDIMARPRSKRDTIGAHAARRSSIGRCAI